VSNHLETEPGSPGNWKRRYTRIPTPVGLWVAWENATGREVSRVRELNAGGMFIATANPPEVGATLEVLLSVPEGEIRAKAIVRNVAPGEGMGVELLDLRGEQAARFRELLKRLIQKAETALG